MVLLLFLVYSFSYLYAKSSSIWSLENLWNSAVAIKISTSVVYRSVSTWTRHLKEVHCWSSRLSMFYWNWTVRSRASILPNLMVCWCLMRWRLLARNSRSQTLSGLAMTVADMASLADVYKLLQKPQAAAQTKYILQFLWCDLTSNYDIIGPYFTSAESVDSDFVVDCVLDTIKLFQNHGLKTSLLVCDGCAANLTAIKAVRGESGAYSILDDVTTDRYEVKPWLKIRIVLQILFIGWYVLHTRYSHVTVTILQPRVHNIDKGECPALNIPCTNITTLLQQVLYGFISVNHCNFL